MGSFQNTKYGPRKHGIVNPRNSISRSQESVTTPTNLRTSRETTKPKKAGNDWFEYFELDPALLNSIDEYFINNESGLNSLNLKRSSLKRKIIDEDDEIVEIEKQPKSLFTDDPEDEKTDDQVDGGGVVKIEDNDNNNASNSLNYVDEDDDDDDYDEDDECIICSESLKTELKNEIGILDECKHIFCFKCIKQWSDRTNSCPLCKREFTYIRKINYRNIVKLLNMYYHSGGSAQQSVGSSPQPGSIKKLTCNRKNKIYKLKNVINGNTLSCFNLVKTLIIPVKKRALRDDDDEGCRICNRDDNWNQLLLCDSCDRGYHMYCLNPPLTSIPSSNWYCYTCLQNNDALQNMGMGMQSEPLDTDVNGSLYNIRYSRLNNLINRITNNSGGLEMYDMNGSMDGDYTDDHMGDYEFDYDNPESDTMGLDLLNQVYRGLSRGGSGRSGRTRTRTTTTRRRRRLRKRGTTKTTKRTRKRKTKKKETETSTSTSVSSRSMRTRSTSTSTSSRRRRRRSGDDTPVNKMSRGQALRMSEDDYADHYANVSLDRMINNSLETIQEYITISDTERSARSTQRRNSISTALGTSVNNSLNTSMDSTMTLGLEGGSSSSIGRSRLNELNLESNSRRSNSTYTGTTMSPNSRNAEPAGSIEKVGDFATYLVTYDTSRRGKEGEYGNSTSMKSGGRKPLINGKTVKYQFDLPPF